MNIEDLSEEEIEDRLHQLKDKLLALSKSSEEVASDREPRDNTVYQAAKAQANFIQEVAQIEFVLEKGSPDEKEAIMHSTSKNIESIKDDLPEEVQNEVEERSEEILSDESS